MMSPLARSLLALAAAALLQGACAEPHCTTVAGGSMGFWRVVVPGFHLDQTDSVTDLPSDACGLPSRQVGVVVTACDRYGAAPRVALLDGGRRMRVSCTWTDGQQCPRGIDVTVRASCMF